MKGKFLVNVLSTFIFLVLCVKFSNKHVLTNFKFISEIKAEFGFVKKHQQSKVFAPLNNM